MSGKERVLAQLRIGPVTIGDFDRQPAIDGGPKITRLARTLLTHVPGARCAIYDDDFDAAA